MNVTAITRMNGDTESARQQIRLASDSGFAFIRVYPRLNISAYAVARGWCVFLQRASHRDLCTVIVTIATAPGVRLYETQTLNCS